MNLTCPPGNPLFYVGLPPKNGSSSIRHWLYEWTEGKRWYDEDHGMTIYQYFRKNCEVHFGNLQVLRASKIAVHRHPVDRMRSLYANKYLEEGWGQKRYPGMGFEHFWSCVKHGHLEREDRRYTFHTYPQTHFLGAQAGLYDAVVPFRMLRYWPEIVREILLLSEGVVMDSKTPFPHEMRSKSDSIEVPDLVRIEIEDHFRIDMEAGWDGKQAFGFTRAKKELDSSPSS